MATGKITQDVIFIEIPYSRFTWDASNVCFNATDISIPSGKKLIGFLLRPTNGSAMLQGYLTGGNVLRVYGWIPSFSQPISSDYQFVCYMVLQ